MKKIPELEEIIEYRRSVKEDTNNIKLDIDHIAMNNEMTLRIFEIPMNDDTKQIAWTYCKNLAKYSHCPVSKSDYKKMQKYINESALIDILLNALDGYYPDNENFILSGFDEVGFYYSVALISQSEHRRNDCLSLLDKLTSYAIANLDDKGSLVLRNMKALEKEYPDLSEFKTKLEDAQK